MFDPEEFGQAMGQMAAEAIEKAVEPLQRRIADLEKTLSETRDIGQLISAEVAKRIAELPAPKDGKDVDMAAVKSEIAEQVRLAVAATPLPKDGRDGADGKDGAPGLDGQGVDMVVVASTIKELIKEAVAALPAARDGRDGANGKDGTDGKSFTLCEAEELLKHHWSGWELDFERRAAVTLEKALERMPKPANGANGKDGVDGLGFDDLQVEHDGGRRVSLKFARGDRVKEFSFDLPVVIDRGIYKDGSAYSAGDGVTWGGSYWIAQCETKSKPDGADSGWRLAVKKGRDGKDGRNGIDKTAPVRLGV
jgi:hypothetical protein